jgi:peptide/nickel transport system permease protein
MAVTALVVTVVVFFMIHLVPGDPAALVLGPEATPERIMEYRHMIGLDEPVPVQFVKYLERLVRGDLGMSIYFRRPVAEMLLNRVETTILLALGAMLITVLGGIALGVVAAVKRGTWIDQLLLVIALLGVSMPSFWLGLLLIMFFAAQLHWLPSSGFPSILRTGDIANLRYLVLPAFTLGFGECALVARMTRSTMLDVLGSEYIVTARAKGLRESRVVLLHALRNASIPIVTVLAFILAKLFAGAVVTETVFALPGVGQLVVAAILSRDYPVIQALLVLVALIFLVANLATDLVYALLDPRVTYN